MQKSKIYIEDISNLYSFEKWVQDRFAYDGDVPKTHLILLVSYLIEEIKHNDKGHWAKSLIELKNRIENE